MPNFVCLIGKGAPLLVNARPKEIGIVGNLTLFYTRGLGIVVSHVVVALPYRFSL